MDTYEYKGMELTLLGVDREHKGYFEAAAQHKLVLQTCKSCGLMRWAPSPGCPWCASEEWELQEVSGKGTIYSYEIIVQAINSGFRDWVPYPVVLVELDEQRGVPTPDQSIRLVANLVDENFEPEKEENVAIGKRVEVVFNDMGSDLSLLQFRLSSEPPQGPVWQYESR